MGQTGARTNRTIAATDPDFAGLFERRNDAESINRALDDTLGFGGAGFIEETPVVRFHRDAKILEIGGGASESSRLTPARGLGLPVG